MALVEDLDVFLFDFGLSVTAGAVSGVGILDMPGETVSDGMVITTDYCLTAKTAEFGGLLYGDAITVGGVNYVVRECRQLSDGAFSEIMLSKLAPGAVGAGSDPRTFGLADLSDVQIRNPELGDRLVYDGSKWVDMEEADGTNVIEGGGAT